jgi:dTDP-glucose 4,6-dehydratase
LTIRDFTFVKDTVRGFIQVAQSKAAIGEVINVGYGKGITIENLAKQIIAMINPAIRIASDAARLRPEASEVMRLICDNRKARQMTDWEPAIPLEVGLQETIAFIKENLGRYRADIYNV